MLISRFRSSSRCSRNDILLAESSNDSGSSSSPGVALGKGTSAMRTLGAVVRTRHVADGRLDRRGRFLPLGRSALFDPDFLVERVLQFVRRALEFSEALAQRLAQLGQLARPENNQGNREDDDEFGDPDRA